MKTGWKKAMIREYRPERWLDNGKYVPAREPKFALVKLAIPARAQVVQVKGKDEFGCPLNPEKKCRCSEAVVKEIIDLQTGKKIKRAWASVRRANGRKFYYRVGETVKPAKAFNTDRRAVCESGIHFFWNRKRAEAYYLC